MDYGDKPELKAILERSAKKVGRSVSQDEIEFFYDELKEYPLKTLRKATEKAMADRDPDDAFLHRAMLTVQETKVAAEKILEEVPATSKVGCERCKGMAWITSEDKLGRLVAWPCKCLYNAAKEALEKKGKKGRLSHIDGYRKQIVDAYEWHQKAWGMTSKAEKETS